MPKVIYLNCPSCCREFYIGQEFMVLEESYSLCPYCGTEFNPRTMQPIEKSQSK